MIKNYLKVNEKWIKIPLDKPNMSVKCSIYLGNFHLFLILHK